MIQKFRKKPVEIHAEQYTEYGKLVMGMCNSRSCYSSGNIKPHVHTIHNNQIVNLEVGDWIIPESDGDHYYPVKPDIFEKTYEPADQPAQQPINPHHPDSPAHEYWRRGFEAGRESIILPSEENFEGWLIDTFREPEGSARSMFVGYKVSAARQTFEFFKQYIQQHNK